MADYYLRSSSATERVNSATYNTGDRVVIARGDAQANFAVMRRYVYECTAGGGGAVAGTVPVYPITPGSTVVDGAITWTCRECTSWTNANKYADYLATRLAAGDRMLVSQAHSETSAVNISITFPGTTTLQCYFLCVDDATGVLSSGASIVTTGSATITVAGSIIGQGIAISAATGAVGVGMIINTGAHIQRWLSCDFISGSTASVANRINYSGGGANAGQVYFEGCRFKLGHSGSRFSICSFVRFNNASFIAGTAASTSIFVFISSAPVDLLITNSDFSELPASAALVQGGSYSGGTGQMIFRNIKMPLSWTGALVSSTITTLGMSMEAYNVDASGSDTNYTALTEDYAGSLRHDTALYLSGTNGMKLNGASVPLSYKMTASATAKLFIPKYGLWRALVNETTTAQTATLEIIHNEAAALTQDDIWMELEYPATAANSNYTRLTNAKADVLATAVAQPTSGTADWDDGLAERINSNGYSLGNIIKSSGSPGSAFICTTAGTSAASVPGGYTTAADGTSITDGTAVFKAMRRQKLTIPFTAAEQGVIRMRPVLALAGAVVWSAAKVSVA